MPSPQPSGDCALQPLDVPVPEQPLLVVDPPVPVGTTKLPPPVFWPVPVELAPPPPTPILLGGGPPGLLVPPHATKPAPIVTNPSSANKESSRAINNHSGRDRQPWKNTIKTSLSLVHGNIALKLCSSVSRSNERAPNWQSRE